MSPAGLRREIAHRCGRAARLMREAERIATTTAVGPKALGRIGSRIRAVNRLLQPLQGLALDRATVAKRARAAR